MEHDQNKESFSVSGLLNDDAQQYAEEVHNLTNIQTYSVSPLQCSYAPSAESYIDQGETSYLPASQHVAVSLSDTNSQHVKVMDSTSSLQNANQIDLPSLGPSPRQFVEVGSLAKPLTADQMEQIALPPPVVPSAEVGSTIKPQMLDKADQVSIKSPPKPSASVGSLTKPVVVEQSSQVPRIEFANVASTIRPDSQSQMGQANISLSIHSKECQSKVESRDTPMQTIIKKFSDSPMQTNIFQITDTAAQTDHNKTREILVQTDNPELQSQGFQATVINCDGSAQTMHGQPVEAETQTRVFTLTDTLAQTDIKTFQSFAVQVQPDIVEQDCQATVVTDDFCVQSLPVNTDSLTQTETYTSDGVMQTELNLVEEEVQATYEMQDSICQTFPPMTGDAWNQTETHSSVIDVQTDPVNITSIEPEVAPQLQMVIEEPIVPEVAPVTMLNITPVHSLPPGDQIPPAEGSFAISNDSKSCQTEPVTIIIGDATMLLKKIQNYTGEHTDVMVDISGVNEENSATSQSPRKLTRREMMSNNFVQQSSEVGACQIGGFMDDKGQETGMVSYEGESPVRRQVKEEYVARQYASRALPQRRSTDQVKEIFLPENRSGAFNCPYCPAVCLDSASLYEHLHANHNAPAATYRKRRKSRAIQLEELPDIVIKAHPDRHIREILHEGDMTVYNRKREAELHKKAAVGVGEYELQQSRPVKRDIVTYAPLDNELASGAGNNDRQPDEHLVPDLKQESDKAEAQQNVGLIINETEPVVPENVEKPVVQPAVVEGGKENSNLKRAFSCPYCSKEFNKSAVLYAHMQNAHKNQRKEKRQLDVHRLFIIGPEGDGEEDGTSAAHEEMKPRRGRPSKEENEKKRIAGLVIANEELQREGLLGKRVSLSTSPHLSKKARPQ